MVIESPAVPLLQFSIAPSSAARLFPVKIRVELMQEGSLVWLSMIFTPLTVGVITVRPVAVAIDTSPPIKKEPFQVMKFSGSLQV